MHNGMIIIIPPAPVEASSTGLAWGVASLVADGRGVQLTRHPEGLGWEQLSVGEKALNMAPR
jgi:hypothetical protein